MYRFVFKPHCYPYTAFIYTISCAYISILRVRVGFITFHENRQKSAELLNISMTEPLLRDLTKEECLGMEVCQVHELRRVSGAYVVYFPLKREQHQALQPKRHLHSVPIDKSRSTNSIYARTTALRCTKIETKAHKTQARRQPPKSTPSSREASDHTRLISKQSVTTLVKASRPQDRSVGAATTPVMIIAIRGRTSNSAKQSDREVSNRVATEPCEHRGHQPTSLASLMQATRPSDPRMTNERPSIPSPSRRHATCSWCETCVRISVATSL